jgi:hypothetical protein
VRQFTINAAGEYVQIAVNRVGKVIDSRPLQDEEQMDILEFPKMLYHATEAGLTKVVDSAEEQLAAGERWLEHAAHIAKQKAIDEPVAAVESSLADAAEAVENAAQKAAKAVRKTKKTAPETTQV